MAAAQNAQEEERRSTPARATAGGRERPGGGRRLAQLAPSRPAKRPAAEKMGQSNQSAQKGVPNRRPVWPKRPANACKRPATSLPSSA